ncbi:unnamed protein product [Chrysoparadoxa australica]
MGIRTVQVKPTARTKGRAPNPYEMESDSDGDGPKDGRGDSVDPFGVDNDHDFVNPLVQKVDWHSRNIHKHVTFEPDKWFEGAHGTATYWVCFSPRGKYMASVGHDKTAVLWKLKSMNTKREYARYEGHKEICTCCVFSPDEKYLLVSSGIDLKIWNTAEGLLRHSIRAHDHDITGVDWKTGGEHFISVGQNAEMHVWNVKRLLSKGKVSGTEGREMLHGAGRHTDDIYKVRYSHNGRFFITCSKDTLVKIWSASTNKWLRDYAGHTKAVLGVSWSASDQVFASCSQDKTVRIWAPSDSIPLHVLDGHDSVVYSVAFCPVIAQSLTPPSLYLSLL